MEERNVYLFSYNNYDHSTLGVNYICSKHYPNMNKDQVNIPKWVTISDIDNLNPTPDTTFDFGSYTEYDYKPYNTHVTLTFESIDDEIAYLSSNVTSIHCISVSRDISSDVFYTKMCTVTGVERINDLYENGCEVVLTLTLYGKWISFTRMTSPFTLDLNVTPADGWFAQDNVKLTTTIGGKSISITDTGHTSFDSNPVNMSNYNHIDSIYNMGEHHPYYIAHSLSLPPIIGVKYDNPYASRDDYFGGADDFIKFYYESTTTRVTGKDFFHFLKCDKPVTVESISPSVYGNQIGYYNEYDYI